MNVIQSLQRSRPQIVHIFDEMVRTVPDGLYLTAAELRGTTLTLRGVAQSNARVSDYMRRLEASDWFKDPRLEVIETRQSRGRRGGGRGRRRGEMRGMDLQELRNLDFRNIGSWPVAARAVAVGVVMIFVLFLGYWFDTRDQLERLERVRQKEAELKRTFERKAAKAVNLEAYKAQLEEIRQTFGTMLTPSCPSASACAAPSTSSAPS